ncbi:MAG: 2Fe-2S iron-sulfur cluster-binding protein [Acidimicrobiia bacterium]
MNGRVHVIVDGVAVPVRSGETVLDVMSRGGFRYPWVCKRGRCAACKVELLSGEVTYTMTVPQQLFSDEEREAGICLTCTAVPVNDIEIRVLEPVRPRPRRAAQAG